MFPGCWGALPVIGACACNTIHAPDGDDGKGGHGHGFMNAVSLNIDGYGGGYDDDGGGN